MPHVQLRALTYNGNSSPTSANIIEVFPQPAAHQYEINGKAISILTISYQQNANNLWIFAHHVRLVLILIVVLDFSILTDVIFLDPSRDTTKEAQTIIS